MIITCKTCFTVHVPQENCVSNNTSAASPEGGDINLLQCLFVIRIQFAFLITSFNDLNTIFNQLLIKTLESFLFSKSL